jgi:hypothetical protein
MKKLLLLALVLGYSSVASRVNAQSSPTTRYNTVADMVNAPILPVGNTNAQARITALVSGRVTANDGGGGLFFFVPGSTTTTNLGTVFPCNGTGRWFRDYSGALNVKWFGAVGNGSTDDTTSLQAALTLGSSIYIPASDYKITAVLKPTLSGQVISGDGSKTRLIQFTGSANGLGDPDII